MGLGSKVKSLLQNVSRETHGIVTPANAISLSRPLIALYGLKKYSDEPYKLSLAMCCAFATDALDGMVAKYIDDDSACGQYVDIFADRSLELITMWSYARDGLIPGYIPAAFTIKGIIVDSTRLYRNWQDGDFTKPLRHGNNDAQFKRASYALVKGSYLSGVPIFNNSLNNMLGAATLILGLYRGLRVIMDSRK